LKRRHMMDAPDFPMPVLDLCYMPRSGDASNSGAVDDANRPRPFAQLKLARGYQG
jgi:hypothetical protein